MTASATRPRAPSSRAAPDRAAAAVALLALVLAAGCAGPRDDDLFGMQLEVRSSQPWASDPGLRARVHELVAASCDHVGLDPSMLWGMTLRIVDGGIACGQVPNARGCTVRGEGLVEVSTLAWTSAKPPVPCVEDTPIPHELLHVKIGDPEHRDPRWDDPYYWSSLSSRVAQADCSGDPAALIW